MGHLLRDLGPWCPEVLAGVLENRVGPGDLCGQAATGKGVPPTPRPALLLFPLGLGCA